MEERKILTPQSVQQDLDALGQYKTADVDRLIRRYVKEQADAAPLREHILTEQQFHRIYYYVNLQQIKDVAARMAFIHNNLLFTDWWHTDQIIRYVAALDFEMAIGYAQKYIHSDDPFIRRWGYVMFISRLGHGHAERLLPLMKADDHYYVQMAQAWLIAELTIFEPEVVHRWMKSCGLPYSICGKAIQKICDSYRISDDWKVKFKALRPELKAAFEAYDFLPAQLARDAKKKIQYKLIKSGARTSQYGDGIDWLIRAGILNKCMKCSQGFYPVAAYQDVSAFKLYYSDLGIMSARLGMTLEALQGKETEHFRGILTENYVAIALKTNGYDLYYWESDNTAEVDFLIQKDSHVIPVECKAGNHVKAKSMMVYMEKYDPVYAIRISARNFGMVNGIKSVPLYSVFCI